MRRWDSRGATVAVICQLRHRLEGVHGALVDGVHGPRFLAGLWASLSLALYSQTWLQPQTNGPTGENVCGFVGVWSESLPREQAAKNYLRGGEQGSAATCPTKACSTKLIVANSGSAAVEAHLLSVSETPVGRPASATRSAR